MKRWPIIPAVAALALAHTQSHANGTHILTIKDAGHHKVAKERT